MELGSGECLRLRAGGLSFLLPLAVVRELTAPGITAPLPSSAVWRAGVMYYREHVITMIDPAALITGVRAARPLAVVVIQAGVEAALMADEANQVVTLPQTKLAEALAGASGPLAAVDIEGDSAYLIDLTALKDGAAA